MKRLAAFVNFRTGGLAILIPRAEIGPSGRLWWRTLSGDRMRLPDDPNRSLPRNPTSALKAVRDRLQPVAPLAEVAGGALFEKDLLLERHPAKVAHTDPGIFRRIPLRDDNRVEPNAPLRHRRKIVDPVDPGPILLVVDVAADLVRGSARPKLAQRGDDSLVRTDPLTRRC